MRTEKYSIVANKNLLGTADLNPDDYQRTSWLYVTNETPFSISLCLFQVTCRYDLPEPYIFDTGTFVGGANEPFGADVHADPWNAGGIKKPIAGTAGHCSVEVKDRAGNTKTLNLPSYPEADEGQFFPAMGWRISVSSSEAESANVASVNFKVERRNLGSLSVKV